MTEKQREKKTEQDKYRDKETQRGIQGEKLRQGNREKERKIHR